MDHIRLAPTEIRYMSAVVNALHGDRRAKVFVLRAPMPEVLVTYGMVTERREGRVALMPVPTPLGIAWYDAIFSGRGGT